MHRDHIVWTLTFIAAVLIFLTASTTHIVPAAYVETVKEVAALAGFLAAYLKASPLPKAQADADPVLPPLR
mgnify:CR=1 FL=1